MSADVVNLAALLIFAAGLAAGSVSIWIRMRWLRDRGVTLPRLIWRDVWVWTLMGLTFGALSIHSLVDYPLRDALWWALASRAPAVIAVGVWLWYELAIIGHGRDG